MKRHQRSFFGQKSGIIFDSGDYDQEYVYITFLKKISENLWEKPSEKQGKKIKLNLGELIMIRRVLMGIDNKWSTVHKFKDEQTIINFSKDQNNTEQIWINVDTYRKNLRPPETEIFLLLIAHVIDEKIEYSTGINSNLKDQVSYSKEYKISTELRPKNRNKFQNHHEYDQSNENIGLINDLTTERNSDKLKIDPIENKNKNIKKDEKKQFYCKTVNL